MKPLSDTRWECRVDSVRAIRYQAKNIIDALLKVADESTDPMAHSQALSLANEVKDYQFLVSIVFWYDILNHINVVSKTLQGETTDLSIAIGMLQRTLSWLKKYRNVGFQSALVDAREIAEEIGCSLVFKAPRGRRKGPISDPKELFRIDCFNQIVDTAIVDMGRRFEQLNSHDDNFGFLLKFSEMPIADISKSCKALESQLTSTNDDSRDIDSVMLLDELNSLKTTLPLTLEKTPRVILSFIIENDLVELYPNAVVAFRIFLTIPVTVASSERSFSKLKLIKTYIRSTMTQQRLTDLAILSIENEIAAELEYTKVLHDFAATKSRKVRFFD